MVRTMEGRLINTDTSDSIGLAVSSNGIQWARGAAHVMSNGEADGLVMNCSENCYSQH